MGAEEHQGELIVMADHHRTRPADPTTTANANRDPSMVPVFTTEMYEAAFSTQGSHPMGGVAMARTLEEARQQLADMLIFADPTAPATAEIIAFHRGSPVEDYDGTAGDIFHKVNAGTPGGTVIARPITTGTGER
jgi:hypothetical protein